MTLIKLTRKYKKIRNYNLKNNIKKYKYTEHTQIRPAKPICRIQPQDKSKPCIWRQSLDRSLTRNAQVRFDPSHLSNPTCEKNCLQVTKRRVFSQKSALEAHVSIRQQALAPKLSTPSSLSPLFPLSVCKLKS